MFLSNLIFSIFMSNAIVLQKLYTRIIGKVLTRGEVMLPGGVFATIASMLSSDDVRGFAFRQYCDGAVVFTEDMFMKYINGAFHSVLGNPTNIIRGAGDEIVSLEWLNEEKLRDRSDGPASVVFHQGRVIVIEYYSNGIPHREDGPAIVHFATHTNKMVALYEHWFRNGIEHRGENLPSLIYRNSSGIVVQEDYRRDGEFHRDGKEPSLIKRYYSGELRTAKWHNRNGLHRNDDQPAHIEYFPNGVIQLMVYHVDGMLHREHDRPAVINFNMVGNVSSEQWYRYDVEQRVEQPLPIFIEYADGGEVRHVEHAE